MRVCKSNRGCCAHLLLGSFSVAGRHLFEAIAVGLAALLLQRNACQLQKRSLQQMTATAPTAAVAYHMAAAVGLHISKLWAGAAAVEMLLLTSTALITVSVVTPQLLARLRSSGVFNFMCELRREAEQHNTGCTAASVQLTA